MITLGLHLFDLHLHLSSFFDSNQNFFFFVCCEDGRGSEAAADLWRLRPG